VRRRFLAGRGGRTIDPAYGTLRLSPPATLALLFATCIAVGALLLKMPFAATGPISWLDALFTATSAVTVTGLTVVDTGSGFTGFGQCVILLLIQLGGLGIVTFAVLVFLLLGHRLGLRQQVILYQDLGSTSLGDVLRLVRVIALVMITAEGIGALVLAVHWIPLLGTAAGLWQAVFHAVSAFNNAGFSLWPDSLARWGGDPLVNAVIPALFLLGGIGFGVLAEARQRRPWRRRPVHLRLMLAGTAVLIVFSVALTALLEWNNPGTLGGLDGWWPRLQAAWLQGVTTRTAGFSSVDIGRIEPDTALAYIVLMFIGGGSTSTAGGIKVTTMIVLLAATWAFLRRRHQVVLLERAIETADVLRSLALAFIGMLLVTLGTFVLVLTQELPFLDLAFEAMSAFATVGLSRGVTGALDAVGQIVLVVLMFTGRIGPLALGFMLATPSRSRLRYPRGRVQLG